MIFEFLQTGRAGIRERDFEILGGQQGFETLANFELRRRRRESSL